MREYEEKEEKIKRKVLKHVICDKCGGEVKKDNMYDVFSFEFKVTKGDIFPEGGCYEEITIDLCQGCIDILIQLMVDKGFKIQREEKDV